MAIGEDDHFCRRCVCERHERTSRFQSHHNELGRRCRPFERRLFYRAKNKPES